MLNIISARWQTLKTNYKKFIPFIFTFIFFFSPLSVSAATPYPFLQNSQPILFDISGNGKAIAKFRDSSGNAIRTFESPNSIDQFYGFSLTTDFSVSNVSGFYWGNNSSFIPFTFIPSLYDYYFIFNVTSNSSPFTFYPNIVRLAQNTCVDGSTDRIFTSIPMETTVYHFDDNNSLGFTAVARCPDDIDNTSVNEFYFQSSSPGSIPAYTGIYGVILALPKGIYGESDLQAVVSAIQNQTDFIINGDSSTGGIVAGADSSKTELESIVSDYQQIENSMLDNFTMYQTDILTDLNGWSWGGLSLCANWVGDTMTSYFQNMGDFKQYIIYPLLLGLALFFIGRGSSIIGHLFRKPTETYTFSERSSSTKYVNGQRITTSVTKSNSDGGVLRK